MSERHFSEIIREAIRPWATNKMERDLITERTKAIIEAIEGGKFVIVHEDIVNQLIARSNEMQKQNTELAALVETRFPKKPLIMRPN